MALSDKALRSLEVGMASTEYAAEVAAAADTPATLSDKTKAHLEVGLASTIIRDEVTAAIEAGSTALSDEARRSIRIMMASNEDGDELSDLIEA